jgi:RNA polymerase sigma factor (TIGR02999 family)
MVPSPLLLTDVTQILSEIEHGDPAAAEQLLPLVYEELRKLAATKLANEKPGQTLQATALVHEAYLRLVDTEKVQDWDSRGHFFAAAAEAMRRILVDAARRKSTAKRAARKQTVLDLGQVAAPAAAAELLALDDALTQLATFDPQLANLVKLRYFAGMTNQEAADCLGISTRTADSYWAYAKAWLLREIEADR